MVNKNHIKCYWLVITYEINYAHIGGVVTSLVLSKHFYFNDLLWMIENGFIFLTKILFFKISHKSKHARHVGWIR